MSHLGKRLVNGIVLNIKDTYLEKQELKEIIDIIDEKPVLNKEQINLIHFMRDNYLCTYLDAYKVMMPPQLKLSKNKRYNFRKKYIIKELKVDTIAERNILNKFKDKSYLKPSEITNKRALKLLLDKNIFRIKEERNI